MLPSPPKPIAGSSRHPQRSLLALAMAVTGADDAHAARMKHSALDPREATGATAFSISRAACGHCGAVFFPDYSAVGAQHCGLDCRCVPRAFPSRPHEKGIFSAGV